MGLLVMNGSNCVLFRDNRTNCSSVRFICDKILPSLSGNLLLSGVVHSWCSEQAGTSTKGKAIQRMTEHNLHVSKAPKGPLEIAGAAASDLASGYFTTSNPGFFGTGIFVRGNKVRVTFMCDGDATAEAIPVGSPTVRLEPFVTTVFTTDLLFVNVTSRSGTIRYEWVITS